MVNPDSNSATPVIFLMGPTASGKTGFAVELSRHLPVEIISVDSAMVYRGMDIGTAKPSPELQKLAPHRLIDICDPAETYSAGRFCRDARTAIAEIQAKGKIPLLTGGTGLYFRALEQGFSRLPVSNPEIRRQLETEAKESGWQQMHDRLAKVDPVSAARINCNDPQRIQRALEVFEISGKPMSSLHSSGRIAGLSVPPLKIIVAPAERSRLNKVIETRFKHMIDTGLIEEVEALRRKGDLSADLPSMRLVGYRQVWAYLQGDTGYAEMMDQAIHATRQLAKRQMTWLRPEQNAVRLEADRPELSQYLLDFVRDKTLISCRV